MAEYLKNTDIIPGKIGLGSDLFGAVLGDSESFRILDEFTDAGGVWIDTANVYGRFSPGGENLSEQTIGRWLKNGGRTKKVIIATKGGHYLPGHPNEMRLSRSEVECDLDDSLHTLSVDCLDFYWLHRDDKSRPIGEIIEYMESFVKAGKIRYYGASNYTAERLFEAEEYAKTHGYKGFSAVSNQFSIAKVNKGCNLNPDPTLVIHGEMEENFHISTGKPLFAFQSTARGYFAKLAGGEPIDNSLRLSFDNSENAEIAKRLEVVSREFECSVQTAVLVETVRRSRYQIIPLTSVRNTKQLSDTLEAIKVISKNSSHAESAESFQ